MLQQAKDFINHNGGALPALVVLIACFNVVTTGISTVLQKLGNVTEPVKDAQGNIVKEPSKILVLLNKLSLFSQTAIDWLQGNKAH
ncbi:MAG: hypothetical protein SGI74_10390 [Oligoflexia bacterium]|nr:hypothetical protein [Oligoflexia bacterium]